MDIVYLVSCNQYSIGVQFNLKNHWTETVKEAKKLADEAAAKVAKDEEEEKMAVADSKYILGLDNVSIFFGSFSSPFR